MALTVETGAQIANADSYISQADADTYFNNRDAPTAWSGLTSALKDSALRYACDTLDGLFDFEGEIVALTQARAWPRQDATDREERIIGTSTIPTALKNAQCELALIHASSALNQTFDRGGAVRSEQAGPVKVEYFESAPAESTWPFIERILNGIGVKRSSGVIEVDRA
jgi:hypothetical protein